ncbi:MAG: hypothetical protein L6U99_01305 [Clostridium sp.]|nr:MAG: hypothetical protein L6U99_01305 [Clostridium sp.]
MALGCELEIISSTQPRTHFFVINDYKIKDEDFINDKSIIEFKKFKNQMLRYQSMILLNWLIQKKERRKQLARDIFKLSNHKRYFDLLQNAISFKTN